MATWIKFHNNFFTHPRSAGLSTTAVTLYLRALCYSNEHLTDGVVPVAAIESWGIARWRHASDMLATRGLWVMSEDCIHVHDYLDYQRSRAEVQKLSKTKAEAGSKGGRAKAKRLAQTKQTPSTVLEPVLAEQNRTEPSSSPPTTEAPQPATNVNTEEETREQFIERTLAATFELMAEQTLERMRAEGHAIHNAAGWKRATAASFAEEHREAALHHIGDRTTGVYYDLHVEVAEALDPRCGPADGGAHRAAMKRAATVAYLHPDTAA